MPPFNLENAFLRSGLPRSALAAFLGLDNALVTRLARGQRPWKAVELKRAEVFFALVPDGYGPSVSRMRRRETRLLATRTLGEALVKKGHRAAFGVALRSAAEGTVELRADQVIALCRKFGIDLDDLVVRQKVTKGKWPADGKPVEAYEEACRDFVGKRGLPAKPTRSSATTNTLGLDVHHGSRDDRLARIASCDAMPLTDNSLEPRYRRGETLYIDQPGRECRYGDDVVVISQGKESLETVIGMLVTTGQAVTLIETPKGKSIGVPTASIRSLRRISFTER